MKKIILIFVFLFNVCFIGSTRAEEVEKIDFSDFMLDKNSLIGKTIKIKGYCRNTFNDKFSLYRSAEPSDFSKTISIDTSNLSREVRKWLMQNCKDGKYITLKAIVNNKSKLNDLNVLEIDEAK